MIDSDISLHVPVSAISRELADRMVHLFELLARLLVCRVVYSHKELSI